MLKVRFTAHEEALMETTPYGRLHIVVTNEYISLNMREANKGNYPVAGMSADLAYDLLFPKQWGWWLARAVVRDKHRSKGCGSFMLRRLLKEVAESKEQRIGVVPGGYSNDSKAQYNFYLKNGFWRSATDELVLLWEPEQQAVSSRLQTQ